ncbi:hypothetical protein SEA_ANGELA_23 [Streptomyces phage Angela]|nr:hypothetical protein SEA_ANGELA_23 [Streptomyces phage Angela]
MTDETDREEADVFDNDVADTVQTIMLMRIYDMLTVIARKISPREADVIFAGHKLGRIFGPAPSFDMSDEVSEDDEATNE